jgi:hypothetical protein
MTPTPTPPPIDPLDPPHVVADALGVSTQTLANWRCTRRTTLPYIKIGRSVRYRRSVWQAFVATAEQAAA